MKNKKENELKKLRFGDVIKAMIDDGTMQKVEAIMQKVEAIMQYKIKHLFDGTIFETKEPTNFLVGSGANFNIYSGYTYEEVLQIYKKLPCFYSTGTKVGKSTAYCTLLEQYNALESTTGYVYTYILPIQDIIFNKIIYKGE